MSREEKKIYLDEWLFESKQAKEQQKAESEKRIAQMGYKDMLCPNIIHNREFLNIETDTLLSYEHQFYIMCDRANKEMFHADYIMGTIYHSTTARLVKVSEKLAEILQRHFSIVLEEYGISMMTLKDLETVCIERGNEYA